MGYEVINKFEMRISIFLTDMMRQSAGLVRQWSQRRMASTLVMAESARDGSSVSESTLKAIKAASQLDTKVHVVLAQSPQSQTLAETMVASIENVENVTVLTHPQFEHVLPESLAPILSAFVKSGQFTHLIAGCTGFTRNLFPRVSALLDVSPMSDVTAIKSEDTFVRPIYAGNAMSTIRSKDDIKIISVRATMFEKAMAKESNPAPITRTSIGDDELPNAGQSQWEGESIQQSDRPELASARVVISGGRALQSKENFDMIYSLADQLGGAVGASRAAVDAGYVSNDLQVGQTGKVVAPELYMAFGISGAIQHLAGMKDAKCIVAVNKDAEAPIFQVADYGLVGDLFKIIPELQAALKK